MLRSIRAGPKDSNRALDSVSCASIASGLLCVFGVPESPARFRSLSSGALSCAFQRAPLFAFRDGWLGGFPIFKLLWSLIGAMTSGPVSNPRERGSAFGFALRPAPLFGLAPCSTSTGQHTRAKLLGVAFRTQSVLWVRS